MYTRTYIYIYIHTHTLLYHINWWSIYHYISRQALVSLVESDRDFPRLCLSGRNVANRNQKGKAASAHPTEIRKIMLSIPQILLSIPQKSGNPPDSVVYPTEIRMAKPPIAPVSSSAGGGWYSWKPSSSSTFSIRVVRVYPLIECLTVPCRAIRGNGISVNSAVPPS